MHRIARTIFHRAAAFCCAAALLPVPSGAQLITSSSTSGRAKVSALGKYANYSPAAYDAWARSSEYIIARDGTRLAADIFRPTRGGIAAAEKLPVVWTHHRYQRAGAEYGQMYTVLDVMPWLKDVLRHGYVVVAVDARGTGASFGRFEGMYAEKETADAYDITEWLAAQPWSSGAIGMYGISYLASTQYMAASTKPPHLKAVFAEKGVADQYALLWSGGIYRGPFIESWTDIVRALDQETFPLPVDADVDGTLLIAAQAEHRNNRNAAMLYATVPYRDSVEPVSGAMPWRDWTPITRLHDMRASKVAFYHLAGWYDRYVRDQLVLFRNLGDAQKITIGPWSHVQRQGLDQAAEQLRWWDYWLKGIDNGVTQEARVHYYLVGAPEESAWRSAPTWPPPETQRTIFRFAAGPSGTSTSINDGGLSPNAPHSAQGSDAFAVDPASAIDPNPRWSLAAEFPDLSANDAKGLTFTSPPLEADIEVTGHPVIHLWISSSSSDADVFAYLEEVDEAGHSRYVSEGSLRASNRAISDPGYDFIDLPYHRGNRADRAPLVPGQPVELSFDLFPTATLFKAGHRIRVSINGADAANARSPEPPSRLVVYRGKGTPSRIDLPILPAR
jgi:uncharacterized protein